MAAMIQIFTLVAKEGQLEEAQKEVARAKEIYEGRGATSARVFWAIEAGEQIRERDSRCRVSERRGVGGRC